MTTKLKIADSKRPHFSVKTIPEPTKGASDWEISRVLDERTGSALVGVEYDNPLHGRQFGVFAAELRNSPKKLRTALMGAGADFVGSKDDQLEMIEELLEEAHKTFMLPKKPGFRDQGFVLGNQMFGTARGLYRQPDRVDRPTVGLMSGTLADWTREVAALLPTSSFASVALMAALAAPLVTYVEVRNRVRGSGSPLVPESMTLNFSGTSGSGRTLISMIAASTFGPSDSMAKWDFTRAGFERLCEESNDLLLILDDTEKHVESEIKLKTAISMVNQYVPGRKSKALSRVGHDGASPPREWSTIGLSSSPKPIDTITAEGGWQRSFGERVRLINIAVPGLESGGVFDNLPKTAVAVDEGSRLAAKIAEGMMHNYGVFFPAWIELLLSEDLSKDIVDATEQFVDRMAPGADSYRRRLARKFGLLFASGALATNKGLLPWPSDWPGKAVEIAYHLACSEIFQDEYEAKRKAKLLKRYVKDKIRFPKALSAKTPIQFTTDTIGVRCKIKGVPVCAIRDQDLRHLAGSDSVATHLLASLKAAGAVYGKQGHAGTMQLPYNIKMPGGKIVRPRFRVFRLDKVLQLQSD